MANKASAAEPTKNLTVSISATAHRRAKLATTALGLTWDQAVAQALAEWAEKYAGGVLRAAAQAGSK